MFVLVKIIIQCQIRCLYQQKTEEIYDASAAVLKGLLNFKPAG
jgi:hypothetical protein